MSNMAVSVRFVKENEDDAADEDMQNAFLVCSQYKSNSMSAEWATADACLSLGKGVTKRNVFVLRSFEGRVFEALSATRGVIVGSRCLSCCLTEGSEIPPGPNPIYTVAMRNLVVTISFLDPSIKKKLSRDIQWMGGRYENTLTDETTHLISGTVLSEKYIKATSLNIPIMQSAWVKAVWEASLTKNISGDSAEFNTFKLPTFHNLILCTSGLSKNEKKQLTALVTENGGKMLKQFESEVVKILITDCNSMGSEKFKAAQKYDIACVNASWVYESIKKGYAIDVKDYTIRNNKTSSPNRVSQLPDMSLNISVIPHVKSFDNMETFMTQASESSSHHGSPSRKVPKGVRGRNPKHTAVTKELGQLVDAIEMKDVKHAGLFLDGCCIFVYGMTATRKEKLHKVISRAGGVRYDQPSDAITHAICGDPCSATIDTYKNSMSRAVHVTVRWLVDSLRAKATVEEAQYLVFNAEKPVTSNDNRDVLFTSPMSKRNLQLLKTPSKLPPVPKFNLDTVENLQIENDDIVQQYLDHSKTAIMDDKTLQTNEETAKEHNSESTKMKTNVEDIIKTAVENFTSKSSETATSSGLMSTEKVEEPIFEGLTFEIQDIEEELEQITHRILTAGGIVIQPGKGSDYVIVPLNCDEVLIKNENSKVITSIWLDECLSKETLVPIEYYHKPVKISYDTKPLEGLVFAISTYTGSEREFIMEVTSLLGGIVQASLHRRKTSSAHRSTHLICPEPSGAKYNGAVNWGLPVVSCKWLMECVLQNAKIEEGPYLIGQNITKNTESAKSISVCGSTLPANRTETKINEIDAKQITNAEAIDLNLAPIENEPVVEDIPNELVNELIQEAKSGDSGSPPLKPNNTSLLETPHLRRKTLNDSNLEMSPMTRILAMAKERLLDLESQPSPKPKTESTNKVPMHNESISTPPLNDALSTPNLALFSPTSRRRLLAIKRGERPSNSPSTPKNPFDLSINTPESSFGKALQLSPNSRKRLWKFCEELPAPAAKLSITKKKTPLTEVCRRGINVLANRIDANKPPAARSLDVDSADTPPSKIRKMSEIAKSPATTAQDFTDAGVENQLKQLSSILTGRERSSSTPRSLRGKRSMNVASPALSIPDMVDPCMITSNDPQTGPPDSQLNTVGWDDMSDTGFTTKNVKRQELAPKVYRFMLSLNVNNCEEIQKIIERLGGVVLESTELDLSATHLICSQLVRSERSLGCIASGRWILHPTYVLRSHEAGRFLDEEPFEWGNPKADDLQGCNPNEKKFIMAVHRWRTRILNNEPLPFASFQVIMHIQEERKGPFLRLLLAGGGKVLNISPPFTGEINATLCLMEQKRMALSPNDMLYLAQRRIPVCPPVLLNSILVEDPPPNLMDMAYPEYKNLLNRK